MPTMTPGYEFLSGTVTGTPVNAENWNKLTETVDRVLLALAEFYGGSGALSEDDFTGTPVDNNLAIQVTGRYAIIGASGERVVVSQSGSVTLDNSDLDLQDGDILPNENVFIFLKKDGTYLIQDNSTPPSEDYHLIISGETNGTEFTTSTSNPVGRVNLTPIPSDGKVFVSNVDDVKDYLYNKFAADGITLAVEDNGGSGKRIRLTEDGKFLASSADSVRKFLNEALVVGSGLTISSEDHGGGKRLRIVNTAPYSGTDLDEKVKSSVDDTTGEYLGTALTGTELDVTVTGSGGTNQKVNLRPNPVNIHVLTDYVVSVPVNSDILIDLLFSNYGAFADGGYSVIVTLDQASPSTIVLENLNGKDENQLSLYLLNAANAASGSYGTPAQIKLNVWVVGFGWIAGPGGGDHTPAVQEFAYGDTDTQFHVSDGGNYWSGTVWIRSGSGGPEDGDIVSTVFVDNPSFDREFQWGTPDPGFIGVALGANSHEAFNNMADAINTEQGDKVLATVFYIGTDDIHLCVRSLDPSIEMNVSQVSSSNQSNALIVTGRVPDENSKLFTMRRAALTDTTGMVFDTGLTEIYNYMLMVRTSSTNWTPVSVSASGLITITGGIVALKHLTSGNIVEFWAFGK